MLKKLEPYFLDLINEKKTCFLASLLKIFLLGLSWIYLAVVFCRNWAFDHGWLRRYSPPVPVVISIGNIVAGGTGKTPVTLLLAQTFYKEAILAILSRGYRSKAENLRAPIVLSRGEGPMHPASFCGDEPYMLAQNLPNVFIYVGKDRHQSSNMAAKAGVQIILLDDGMQHRRLARDFEVVVMDAGDPFGKGYHLPRGFLREGLQSLSRADIIVLNHVTDREKFFKIKEQIAKYSAAPIVGTFAKVEAVLDLNGQAAGELKKKRLGLFCGIAHPDYFEKTIQTLGAEIINRHIIPDHMNFEAEALLNFSKVCALQGADALVCTEKDRVKLVDPLDLALPVVWIRMRLEFVEGQNLWEDFTQKVKSDLGKRI